MKCYIRKAPGRPPRDFEKNVQQAGFTSSFLYSHLLSSCQSFFLKMRLNAGQWLLNPSGLTAIVLVGGGL